MLLCDFHTIIVIIYHPNKLFTTELVASWKAMNFYDFIIVEISFLLEQFFDSYYFDGFRRKFEIVRFVSFYSKYKIITYK